MESSISARPAPEVALAVWEAEDGRCEACKRPMDKRVARVARLADAWGGGAPRWLAGLSSLFRMATSLGSSASRWMHRWTSGNH